MIKTLATGIFCLMLALCTKAQTEFKGGQPALDDFMQSHIIYPEYASQHCIPGTVKIAFNLTADGAVINARVQDGPGVDLDDEALRVVKLTSGHWLTLNKFSGTIIIPVKFNPDPARCAGITQADIDNAINNYQAQQSLRNAVITYYTSKYQGKADTTQQALINNIKAQLGYDYDFITGILNEATAKLKQGDRAGACTDWQFIRNIGSPRADVFLKKYCTR